MTIQPGDTKLKDPDSTRVAEFDLDAFIENPSAAISTATVVATGPDSALVVSNVTPSGRVVNYTVSGGTLGSTYVLTCHFTTNEAPPQIDDRSIFVLMQNL